MQRADRLLSLAGKLRTLLDGARKLVPENIQLLMLLEKANEEIARLLREQATTDSAARPDKTLDL